MPDLPPDLHEDIVRLLCPLAQFRLPQGRLDLLDPYLGKWEGRYDVDWSGGSYSFFQRFVQEVPEAELDSILRNQDLIGVQDITQIEGLRRRMAHTGALVSAAPDGALTAYSQLLVRDLSSDRRQLDSRFVQLTLLLDQGPEAQGVRFVPDPGQSKYDSLAILLEDIQQRAVVLLGRPGSGKTTLLRRLQLEKAWQALDESRGDGAAGQTSFFISLNSYRGDAPGEPPPPPYEWLENEWRLRYPQLPSFKRLFQNGELLLLLDGLNEMPHRDKTDYRERVGLWQAFLGQCEHFGNTFVFSCRSLDYSASLSSEAVPVPQVRVEPLADGQIKEFLHLHLQEEAADIWTTLRQDAQQMALFATPFFLQLLVDQVSATGEVPGGQAALLTGFVRRTLHREVVERRHRLFAPGSLLSENDVEQVIQQAWPDPYYLPGEGLIFVQLESLAYQMQDAREAGEAAQVRLPETAARSLISGCEAGELIDAGIQLNVLDKELAKHEISFYHQLVQEYFAARLLARKPEPERLLMPWRVDQVAPSLADTVAALEASDPLPPLPATGWEETAVLAAAMTADQEGFVTGLMAANLPLAARCAAAIEVQVSPRLAAELQEALLLRIGDTKADLRGRVAAAEALGELGDPRFERQSGPHGDYLLPPLASIKAGEYAIGSDDSSYDDEKPEHKVAIAAFEMGLFPVTNAEYEMFIQAGGYEEERWWETEAARAWLRGEGGNEGVKQGARDMKAYLQDFSDEAIRGQSVSPEQINYWLWLKHASAEELEQKYDEWYSSEEAPRQPAYWEDSSFNHPAQPVVGVSWFEARAYCAWLSAQSGETFSLPSEVEWEAAARGFGDREYAYGPEFDAARCNTYETHIRRTTPAGVFPGGLTPQGIADLSGNVWEWTTTIWGEDILRPTFTYPYVADDGREDSENALARRVVRGGSWYDGQNVARSAYRDGTHPAYRGSNGGFRLVVCRPPSQVDH